MAEKNIHQRFCENLQEEVKRRRTQEGAVGAAANFGARRLNPAYRVGSSAVKGYKKGGIAGAALGAGKELSPAVRLANAGAAGVGAAAGAVRKLRGK